MLASCGSPTLEVRTDGGDMSETFQITLEQAKAYDEQFVPALFAQWAPRLLDIAQVSPGDRVLDVACGTGVLARAAAERVGDAGLVVGIDINPAMLEVARDVRPDIEWRDGDAVELPVDDGSFDAVLCQSALFFFPDPAAAIREMSRVAKAGGAVAVQSYASIEAQPGYGAFVDAIVKHAGPEAKSPVTTYFAQGDPHELTAMFTAAGLNVTATSTPMGVARYPSVEAFVDVEVKGSPLVDQLTDEEVERILAECRDILHEHQSASGELAVPIRAVFIAGRKG
jgi:ubiquinone/menaquinone biosynthesis C-methylase UbiE